MIYSRKTLFFIVSQFIVSSLYSMSEWTEISKVIEKQHNNNGNCVTVITEDTTISDLSLKIIMAFTRCTLQAKDNSPQVNPYAHSGKYDEDIINISYRDIISAEKSHCERIKIKEYDPGLVQVIAEYFLKDFSPEVVFDYNCVRKGIVEGSYSLDSNKFVEQPKVYFKVEQY